ncbi:MAG: polysaccharide pyruvyl transferase family protein [Fusobacterium sp. JB019]|nr:polysaccharide pyruvyl transferase family protein [Fusobacterium sp. JB019]
MKKIGILTFYYPENRNFGALLQTYASFNILKELNHSPEIINYNNTRDFKNKGAKGKIFLLFNMILGRVGLFIYPKNKKIKLDFYFGFKKFLKNFLKLTLASHSTKKLKKLNKTLDIFIVGSDQVWRMWNKNDFFPSYFLDFVDEDKKKISYAASFGLDEWKEKPEITSKVRKLLKRFDYISVREESGIDICKKTFGIDSVCVLDPTLVLPKEKYQLIIDEYKDKSHLNKKYIAHMLLDDNDNLRKYSNKIADRLKCEINYIKGHYKKILWKKIFVYNGVGQWLTYLKDSELVITDSFHCTVFSIIFHKKFIVIANPQRGNTRLENLLNIVGLEDRFFTDIKEVENSGILEKEINYEEVEKKLNVKRKYSIDFLKNALGEN